MIQNFDDLDRMMLSTWDAQDKFGQICIFSCLARGGLMALDWFWAQRYDDQI